MFLQIHNFFGHLLFCFIEVSCLVLTPANEPVSLQKSAQKKCVAEMGFIQGHGVGKFLDFVL